MKRLLISILITCFIATLWSWVDLYSQNQPEIGQVLQAHPVSTQQALGQPKLAQLASLPVKDVPAPTPAPVQAPAVSTPAYTGSHQDWMQAAGIPASDWGYVDYIVSHESGWRPDAVNPSSGSCSLAQALPCSKIGAGWRDPVVALKWMNGYVARYGGWAGAASFWALNHWY